MVRALERKTKTKRWMYRNTRMNSKLPLILLSQAGKENGRTCPPCLQIHRDSTRAKYLDWVNSISYRGFCEDDDYTKPEENRKQMTELMISIVQIAQRE